MHREMRKGRFSHSNGLVDSGLSVCLASQLPCRVVVRTNWGEGLGHVDCGMEGTLGVAKGAWSGSHGSEAVAS